MANTKATQETLTQSKYLKEGKGVPLLEAIPNSSECYFMGTRMSDDYFIEVVLPLLPEKPLLWSPERILIMLESAGYAFPTNIPSIHNAVRSRNLQREANARQLAEQELYRRTHFPTTAEQQEDRLKAQARKAKVSDMNRKHHGYVVEESKVSRSSKATGSIAFLD